MLYLGTGWPHRGHARGGGGLFLKNDVIGGVTLTHVLSFEVPFFLHLDKDNERFWGLLR